MALYAISDLHLSFGVDKPMGIFGEKWVDHHLRIKENWINKISYSDTVIIGGDISWGMSKEEGFKDLEWLNSLPGNKMLIRGNHDYWWSGIKKLNSLYDNMMFIQNNFFPYGEYAICGTRGWICPGGYNFKEDKDRKIYNRECIRAELSLKAAKDAGYNKIIFVTHYPPFNEKREDNEFIGLFKTYEVEKVIYGHLHGIGTKNAFEGEYEGIEFILTSVDHIDFDPVIIL
ncbi:metallophosphoesterase [Oceanirhabdus sp. W0125-5]|uniref:metallophosphoesterase n=1 Tax=Oceanirhabdus sp. W0125-5 TaxID=2999116 RepID=UPI0022F2C241|nr:metallophosphoesterase [Oceanirhabdus sp. W0125-5]WBW98769.1 metallophosphoesterase [Oceanirhabdus sp. W0125-5]